MKAKTKRSKAARTRGPDLVAPLNVPTLETPGFGTEKVKRTIRDLRNEHREEMLAEAQELAKAGATDFEIAEHYGVALGTLQYWRSIDPVLNKCLELTDDVANARVKRSLFHRATGYSYRTEKIMTRTLPDGGGSEIVRVPVIEHVPPDNTAMIFWLKNRDRAGWRDVQDHRVEGKIEVEDKRNDPRALAMAILAALREAAEAQPVTIEHAEAAE